MVDPRFIDQLFGDVDLSGVQITSKDGTSYNRDVDYFIPLFGLSPKLGPLKEWGLDLNKESIAVDTLDYSTNVPGIYAIGAG